MHLGCIQLLSVSHHYFVEIHLRADASFQINDTGEMNVKAAETWVSLFGRHFGPCCLLDQSMVRMLASINAARLVGKLFKWMSFLVWIIFRWLTVLFYSDCVIVFFSVFSADKNDYFDLNLVHIVCFNIFNPQQIDRKLQLWNNSLELLYWISYIFQDSLLSSPHKAVIIRLNLTEVGNVRAEQMKVHEIDLCPTVSWSAIPDWMHHKVCVDVELYWLSSIVIKRQIWYNNVRATGRGDLMQPFYRWV